ncbi:SDR family oxidoreductase [Novosphingobium sp. Fuku2-ISO-50]|uniref:SDR family NAD(P)-dependent oxidoreductase n=1 Tax=Novosphingobium sp. Fuku2-ISO-50 TaxID=1739114 RepID=UPI00076DF391|nr:SDR family NAD(P)-dependent oxidoreductase [Novosphingobium sp. Fuku2-ISO-50]KUR76662.1 short-chain dehydrogenase [Novosphingobium sp. Fuku2-ISO-50]
MRPLARLPLDPAAFREKFGPWAVIAGASEGTGECYARQLAAMGINLVLVSRRQAALDALGAALKAEFGIDTRAVAQDLTEPGAGLRIVEAARDCDVGLYISNAGADGFASFFEDSPEAAHRLVRMNISTLIDAANGFGKRMLARGVDGKGRGGIIVMASGAGLGGQPNLALYSATKAFEINFAESLWAEYHERGIDIIGIAAPIMRTPTLLRMVPEGFDTTDVYDPADVTHNALAGLLAGAPLQIVPDGPGQEKQPQVQADRIARLIGFVEFNKQFTAG